MGTEFYLDLSTGHMTEKDRNLVDYYETEDVSPLIIPRIVCHEYGCFMFLSEDVFEEHCEDLKELDFSDTFITVLKHAVKNGCYLINFDRDAETIDKLPVFDW